MLESHEELPVVPADLVPSGPTAQSGVIALGGDQDGSYGLVLQAGGGSSYSLALKSDGTVVVWGGGSCGETNVPTGLSNVVAIAAAWEHSLALTMDGRVWAWGDNRYGQCNVSPAATNVVALGAGVTHDLAVRADGTVVAWGDNSSGACDVPNGLSNVVAVASGYYHSVALRSDGSVVMWGDPQVKARLVPASATNILAVAAGGSSLSYTLFLVDRSPVGAPAAQALSFIRSPRPDFVYPLLRAATQRVLTELDFDLHAPAIELSGAKALLHAVLELGMPDTMERDDVMHGYFYGSESLPDLAVARGLLTDEVTRLGAPSSALRKVLQEVAAARFACCSNRLQSCLNNLATTGQPEIPRLLGHTLRLASLLRDAWAPVPPPALEISIQNHAPCLLLYGEPYVHYALQYQDRLAQPVWSAVSLTNDLHNQETVLPPAQSPARFYRALTLP